TVSLTTRQWGICLLGPIVFLAIAELGKLLDRRTGSRRPPARGAEAEAGPATAGEGGENARKSTTRRDHGWPHKHHDRRGTAGGRQDRHRLGLGSVRRRAVSPGNGGRARAWPPRPEHERDRRRPDRDREDRARAPERVPGLLRAARADGTGG